MTRPQQTDANPEQNIQAIPEAQATQQTQAKIIQLRPPSRWHDPLKLIQEEAPSEQGRIVLWVVSILILLLIVWAAVGQLDIIASAEGKLTTKTLVKIVQPSEAGVIKELAVEEGDIVKAGQLLAKLDTTLAKADKTSVASDLAAQQMQMRRIQSELADQPMLSQAGDVPQRYAQVHSQYIAHRQAYLDGLDQEKSLLAKAEQEKKSAAEVLVKLEQTLPTYKRSAEAYAKLEREGFIAGLVADEKKRDAIEKAKDLDAQKATVASLDATITAEHKKIRQLQSNYKSELEKELADIRAKIEQLQPTLDKTLYKEGQMELRAPQDGIIKDLATTTIGAVVQPGTVIMSLVPQGEQLYADVNIKNEDVGFVQVGQHAQIKLSSYPFQQYGMLSGKVIRVSADATENKPGNTTTNSNNNPDPTEPSMIAIYKARIKLDSQTMNDPQGNPLTLTPGMQVIAEINQGKRSVLEYLLSPVQKAVNEAARER
jgi:hemolysin D